jgi:hypothetical protein
VLVQALALDIGRQLAAYEVEYHVLQEEMAAGLASPPSSPHPISSGGSLPFDSPPAKWDRLEKSNQVLQKQVRDLQNQLQSSKTNYRVLEANLTAQQAMYTRLERQVCPNRRRRCQRRLRKKVLNWRFALFITDSYTIVKQTELP